VAATTTSLSRANEPAVGPVTRRPDACARLAYHYLAAVDVEGFSALNALEQMETQVDLGWVLDFAADRANLCRAGWQRQVRGDGELAVLPPDTDGPRLIADYPRELAGALRYGSCRSLSWRLVGVGVPALVGLLGLVLVAAAP
jgi:hypothetical protein